LQHYWFLSRSSNQSAFIPLERLFNTSFATLLGALTVDQEEALKALTRSLANQIAQLRIPEIRREAKRKAATRKMMREVDQRCSADFPASDVHAVEAEARS
jgi:hypothetical protein